MSRDQVFISYCHTDKKWLERLQIHLTPLQRDGTIKPWADTAIKPGQLWKEEIEKALARAKVAVLLVSPDFLASKFIQENELPPLLEANKKEGLTILWVQVESCHYERTVVAQYQAAHDLAKPLSDMSRAKWNKALVEIVKKIEAVAPPLSPSPPNPSTVSTPSTPSTPPATLHAAHTAAAPPAIQNIHGWSASQVQALQSQVARAFKMSVEFQDILKDGSAGPVMVVIPGGRFLMGSPPDEPERRDDERQHEVEVASFVMGKYAVTFEEYDRFAATTQRKELSDPVWGRGRRPVININWSDAVAYAEWLSQQTGQTYRLPTEAEWEYAARAGTKTAYWWGSSIEPTQANFGGKQGKTMPVDAFQPNPFDLYQVHGNVWEWTCSEYDEKYGGAELRSVSNPNSGGPRVVRGGSWPHEPGRLRSAARDGSNPRYRNFDTGFRLARTLTF